MTFEIEIFFPASVPGTGAKTETLGLCKIITQPVFVTVTEHNGDAKLVGLEAIVELDREAKTYLTALGKAFHPRRIDLPDRIYVEVSSGYARAIDGDQIARMKRAKGDSSGLRISW